ncbi:type I-F CRISPR-associated protein Csy3 [Marispirochaeta sp.]|uniref:type I-F CRISPR-associated protein Csy3 n=1 Tax=Marispirochaeta sp. TaxID=2038653 RepID=UPI0029C8F223|nr:type I-F CRISPR-associated protein Csy3 [Marispirochaeta sp.]
MAKKENTASVLAFEKKMVPSDGYMYGTQWENRESVTPLKLKEKSVRGTISNRLKPAIQNDPVKLNKEVEKANLQTVDSCALQPDQDTLKLHFTLKILGNIHVPSACNNALFKQSYAKAAKGYVANEGFNELSRRYALNIANARFLWRNRIGAEDIEVIVKALNKDAEQEWIFDSIKYSPRDMEISDAAIESLSERIASALASEDGYLLLEITCFAKAGKSQDVYPSEELVLDKGKGNKSKVLYHVDGIAAMHSQKIGNALRTIDTWYPEFSDPELSIGPIAVEPYGSVTNLGKAYRTPKDKKDFYTLFDSWARGSSLSCPEDEHYVMAVLVRGGVFGESDK